MLPRDVDRPSWSQHGSNLHIEVLQVLHACESDSSNQHVHIVHILRDQEEAFHAVFKFFKCQMPLIWFNIQQLPTSLLVKFQTSSGFALQPSGVATSSIRWFSHNPSESRNVRIPDSALIPAPVDHNSDCFVIMLSSVWICVQMKTHQNPFDTQGLRQDFHQSRRNVLRLLGLIQKQFVADLVVLWKVGCIAGLSFEWLIDGSIWLLVDDHLRSLSTD